MTPLTLTQPFHTSFSNEARCNNVKCRLASGSLCEHSHPAHRLLRCTHDKAAFTPAQPLLPVRPSLPLVTRDCQPRCQHTLTQATFFNSRRERRPPRLPQAKFGTRMALTSRAPARARRRFTCIDQKSSRSRLFASRSRINGAQSLIGLRSSVC